MAAHTAVLLVASLAAAAAVAGAAGTNDAPDQALLTGGLGMLVTKGTNEIPAGLLPPGGHLAHQVPAPQRGSVQPEPVRDRIAAANEAQPQFGFFPAAQPVLPPYLVSQDEFGNTAAHPAPLIPWTPIDSAVQQAKYWLSERGLRYSLQQTVTFVNMTQVMQGDNVLGFYTFDLKTKWAVFSEPASGSAGWVSAQIEAKSGLGDNGASQSPRANLGTIIQPADIWTHVNGWRVPELAWQQSLHEGQWVVLAGMLNQENYLDANPYANSGRGQFMNSALVNSMVAPFGEYNFGANLQWQPVESFYAMVGTSVGSNGAGQAPWTDLSFDQWSTIGEIGFTPANFLGLGPGAYRIQPFVARLAKTTTATYTVTIPGTTNTTDVKISSTAGGPVQGGLCFNLRQQLGEQSPVGWFGRFGFGGAQATAGASAQVGTGLVMRGPLAALGLFPEREHDTVGAGFIWSQPSAGTQPVAHENEFGFEAGYVLQLTPFARLQPDLQVIWNPAYNPDSAHAVVFQLQLEVAW